MASFPCMIILGDLMIVQSNDGMFDKERGEGQKKQVTP